jgi:hypothetical protein
LSFPDAILVRDQEFSGLYLPSTNAVLATTRALSNAVWASKGFLIPVLWLWRLHDP